jgi:hypothetical protein
MYARFDTEADADFKEGIFKKDILAFEYRLAHDRIGITAPEGIHPEQ